MAIKHAFTSEKSDGGDATLVRPSDWNADHVGEHTHPTVKKTSGQNFATSTLADVTEMVFALTAGVYYHFRFVVLFRSDTATVGIKLGLTTPAFTTFGATARIPIAAAGAGGELQGWITASGGSVTGTAVAVINTDYVAVVEGVILPSADGNLQLRAANETGTTTVTVRQGTIGMLFPIA